MSSLFDFLTDFVINPKQQMVFAKHPDDVMVAAGLSKAEQAVVKSRSSYQVADVFAHELTQAAVVCGDPGPDPLPDPDPPSPPDSDDSVKARRAIAYQHA